MIVQILEEPISQLGLQEAISIAFQVDRLLEVSTPDGGIGGITLREHVVDPPYMKDYDAIKDEGPTRWLARFDTTNWGLVAAFIDGNRVGGAVIAYDSAGVDLLENRSDLAALWDIRVSPALRRAGVGRQLFRAVETWACERHCTQLEVETQNVNVPACHFYRRMGCSIRSIDRFAYPNLPTEVKLVWLKDL
jgi:ribosomal protein S18 acetylase RimI-like enzyme